MRAVAEATGTSERPGGTAGRRDTPAISPPVWIRIPDLKQIDRDQADSSRGSRTSRAAGLLGGLFGLLRGRSVPPLAVLLCIAMVAVLLGSAILGGKRTDKDGSTMPAVERARPAERSRPDKPTSAPAEESKRDSKIASAAEPDHKAKDQPRGATARAPRPKTAPAAEAQAADKPDVKPQPGQEPKVAAKARPTPAEKPPSPVKPASAETEVTSPRTLPEVPSRESPPELEGAARAHYPQTSTPLPLDPSILRRQPERAAESGPPAAEFEGIIGKP